jgi:hypothetical protein
MTNTRGVVIVGDRGLAELVEITFRNKSFSWINTTCLSAVETVDHGF